MKMFFVLALFTTTTSMVFATTVNPEAGCASSTRDNTGMGSCLLQISRSSSQLPKQNLNLAQEDSGLPDPWLDKDYPEDNQPGAEGAANATPAPNASELQILHAADPPPAPAANASAAPAANGTAAAPKNETAAPSANATVNISTPSNSTSVNATGCATREDPRVRAWLAETSPAGTPCIFGVDVRDEGKHCVFGGGEFGSNGWCYTAKDKSSWGSCNERCPLFGPPAALGKAIDKVAKKVEQVADKLGAGDTALAESSSDSSPNVAAPADAGATTTQTPLASVTSKAAKA